MKELSNRSANFTDSVIRRMTRVANKYGAVNLSQGFPDFEPPKAAGFIAEGLKKAGDIEVRCFNIDNVDFDYVAGVDMAIFGSPTYMASVTGKMKNWLEVNVRKLGLAGKLGGAFAS